MSGKINKKMRKEVRRAGSEIYDEIVRQVNALPLIHRIKLACRIICGKW
ncbi:MAG: hypothetical protein MJ168_10955 [Clostridia bacterium]|nr:hypothetical protein [Clostridia bacterium]